MQLIDMFPFTASLNPNWFCIIVVLHQLLMKRIEWADLVGEWVAFNEWQPIFQITRQNNLFIIIVMTVISSIDKKWVVHKPRA